MVFPIDDKIYKATVSINENYLRITPEDKRSEGFVIKLPAEGIRTGVERLVSSGYGAIVTENEKGGKTKFELTFAKEYERGAEKSAAEMITKRYIAEKNASGEYVLRLPDGVVLPRKEPMKNKM